MTVRTRSLQASCIVLALLLVGVVSVVPADAHATTPVITYGGRAYAAYLNVPTVSVPTRPTLGAPALPALGLPAIGVPPTYLADTGALPRNGGLQTASVAATSVTGVLTAELLVANTRGANGVAESSASLSQVNVLNGLLTAAAVRAESRATCSGVRGSTEVLDLELAGTPLTVDPFTPNQTFGPITVPGVGTVTVVVNEQRQTPGAGSRAITVNALRLAVRGLVQADIVLASAKSDIAACPGCAPPPACHDYVSGGGWIKVGNGRADFGFNVGLKDNGRPDAHFNFVDRTHEMHVKVTSVVVYKQGATATSLHLEGDAEINGVPGFAYVIDVADNGEPGRGGDTLRITLSNGYTAGGPLAGGNIQLHKPCP
jgi:hypothetical protein